ncbi:isocitrate lyase/phosphoenolpyruvate mutase family protein [Massilia genomosp. 1]|uniref:isocitrate lyase/phosphoenolpyruvate mutase family protein n=1 Tax=Massilia genomosp. 1 TaxID=2609280 RepID=UPI001423D171
MAGARGVNLFINARTDVYLLGEAGGFGAAVRVEETIRRAALYEAAGASGLFVPGMAAEDGGRGQGDPPAAEPDRAR